MTLRDFFHGYGEIDIKGSFVSARLVKDALRKKFMIAILDESPNHITCKIHRLLRLAGGPYFFPNPTLEIFWRNETGSHVIRYSLTCFDYYIVLFCSIIFGLMGSTSGHTLQESLAIGFIAFLVSLLFFGGLVFLDTKFLCIAYERCF